ncbi:glycosyltransferase [Bosea sp. PAMC 26642]|uniref:glycosyltransferase n=1 Tax=Bosea sp. (strain PAMC 26642) TaxID=1792307 RepID=UPI0007701387|nr:glycosyltransferase [Bosea sp. PAMC 26642]AMJ62026.1 glycosyl transferase [Bosea sp. PAMC 26642]
MKLTIGIKALNEERHIAAALGSAVEAAGAVGGEVILADSGSVDRTIEIAGRYPVRIVQLADPNERSCGAGAQLAFQHAQGEYFYLLDGDMVIEPGFLPAAIAFIEANPDVAGVGGHVQEMHTQAQEFQIRAESVRREANWLPGTVDRLDCGGLYRASAIREAGYFADRNLHAFEEFDLGARLRARGWKLARIDVPAVKHYGHAMDGYRLMWKRFRSGYSGATGEVLRGALGREHFKLVLRDLGHIRNGIVVILWWVLLIALAFAPGLSPAGRLGLILAALLVPIGFLSVRRRSIRLGLYSFVSWNAGAAGLIAGFFRKRVPPRQPLASVTVGGEQMTAR